MVADGGDESVRGLMLDPGWCGWVLEGPAPPKHEPSTTAFGGGGVAGEYGGHGLE